MGEMKVEYSRPTEKQHENIEEFLHKLGKKRQRATLVTILSDIATGGLESRQSRKAYRQLLLMEEFRNDIFTEDEEIELALTILKGARGKKRIDREFEALKETFYFKDSDTQEVATSRSDILSLINHQKVLSDVKSKAELLSSLLDLCMHKESPKDGGRSIGSTGEDSVDETEDKSKNDMELMKADDASNGSTGEDDVDESEDKSKNDDVKQAKPNDTSNGSTDDVDEAENESENDDLEESDPVKIALRSVTALAIICFTRSNQCSRIQKLLGLHLLDCGVTERKIKVFNHMGVSVSIGTLTNLRHDLKAISGEKVTDIANSGQEVVADDDIEQREGVMEQARDKTDDAHPDKKLITPSSDTINPPASKKARIT